MSSSTLEGKMRARRIKPTQDKSHLSSLTKSHGYYSLETTKCLNRTPMRETIKGKCGAKRSELDPL